MKGDSLWETSENPRTATANLIFPPKGDSLWETSENPRTATAKISFFRLKVIVYGMKGDICIEKKITCMVSYITYPKETENSDALS